MEAIREALAKTKKSFEDAKKSANEMLEESADSAKKQTEALGKVVEATQKASEANKKHNETIDKTVESTQKASEAEKKKAESTDKTTEATKKVNEATKEQNSLLDELGKQLKNRLNEIKLFGAGLGNITARLRGVVGNLRGAISELGKMRTSFSTANIALSQGATAAAKFSTGMRLMRAAIISIGIGALIVLLGSLVGWLQQSEKITQKVGSAMAAFGTAIKNSGNFLKSLGNSMISFFTLRPQKAFREAGEAMGYLRNEMIQAAKDTYNYNQVLAETKRILEGVERASGLYAKRFVELDAIINSNTASYNEKLSAINEKQAIQVSALDIMIRKQQELVNASTTQEEREEAVLKLRELEAQKLTVELGVKAQINRMDEERRRIQERITEEARKEAEQRERIRESLENTLDNLQKKYESLNAKSLSPLARINEEERIALEELDRIFDDLKKKHEEVGADITRLQEIYELGKAAVEVNAAKKREDLLNGHLGKIKNAEKKSLEDRLKEIEGFTGDAEKEIREMMDLETKFPEDPFGKLEDKLKKSFEKLLINVFEIQPDKIGFFLDRAGTLISGMFQQWTQFTNLRIRENERLLESVRDQKKEFRDLLEQELEDAAAGYRNDVSNARERYEEIIEMERKAMEETEKLKKQQVIVAETTTGIVTALNLAKAASEMASRSAVLGPIAGPIAFAIGMGSILLTFAKIRSQIKAIKLFTGGSLADVIGPGTRDHGFVNRTQGRDDRNGRGHRIEDSNVVVGGNEFINNSRTSLRYAEFLERLNTGKLDHVDLNSIGRQTVKQYPVFNPQSKTMTDVRNAIYFSHSTLTKEDMKDVILELFPDMFDSLGQRIENKKGITYKPDGTRVEYTNKRRTEIR